MRARRRAATFATLGALLAVLLGACTSVADPSADDPSQPQDDPANGGQPDTLRGGTLRFGLTADPVTIDPRFVVDDEGELVVDALFDPLVRLDRDLRLVPSAAARWEVDEAGRVFTFHLRRARFHDGTPVTAQDFRRTFARIADGRAEPRSFLAYLLASVEGFAEAQRGGELSGVEVLDDRTLEIRLTRPEPGFLTVLANPSLAPVPPVADADPEGFALQPIGNGPFQMSEPRELEAFLRLSRYQDHHRAPLLDEVVFQIYSGDQGSRQQWDDLVSGQLQVAEIPPDRLEDASELFGVSSDGYTGPGVLGGPTSAGYLYGFDTTTPPFDDPRVRRAISMAIDREALAEEVLQGSRVPATAYVPPAIPGSQPGSCRHCEHDSRAAAALFEEVMAELDDESPDAADEPDADDVGTEGDGQVDVPPAAGSATGSGPASSPGTAPDTAGDTGVDGDLAAAGDDDDGTDGAAPEDGDDPAGGRGDDADLPDDGEEPAGTDLPDDADLPDGEEPADTDVAEDHVEPLESLTLTHNRGRTHTAIAERMASDIESALGIEVDLRARDLQPFIQDVRRGEAAFFRLGWDADTPSPDGFLYPLFHSSQTDLDNTMNYVDEEVDVLLEEARANHDRVAALEQYREAEDMILDDAPALPLLWYRHLHVVAPRVWGLHYSPLGRVTFDTVWFASEG